MTTIEQRAEEFAKTKSQCARCKFCEDYADDMKCDKYNKYVELYIDIATEQKAIDDAQWHKDMEYVNVKKQELIDKVLKEFNKILLECNFEEQWAMTLTKKFKERIGQ